VSGEGSAIRWRSWSKDAFEEAKRADRPILLRLSAVWCHWCHVMDNTSDKDARVITLLNERYVPIRVDIDKMPDVRERYNFGGYPTSAFLTPGGDILTGGTYIPPDQFVQLLEAVDQAYKNKKDEILKQLEEHRTHHQAASAVVPQGEAGRIAEQIYEDATAAVLGLFDPQHGGFGSQPKFPHGAATILAIRAHLDSGKKEYETVALRTLDAMKASQMWDREELAFYRYCVRSDWTEPHYEKMLETNAGLLSAYAFAYGVWGRAGDLATINDMRTYLERVLRDPRTGLFRGSQDADEEYYGLALDQRTKRKPPFVDPTHYTDWTAMMASAYCRAYRSTGDASWLTEAGRTMDSLVRLAFRPADGFLHFIRDGKAERGGILSDQAHGARALLDLYELTGTAAYLQTAEALATLARKTMWDPVKLRYNDKARQEDDLGLLAQPQSSVVDNGVMADVLARLARHQADGPHGRQLEELLRGHDKAGERFGIFASELALAALSWGRPPLDVHVTGSTTDVAQAIQESSRIRAPGALVLRSEKPWPSAGQKLGRAPPAPSAFFCSDRACSRIYKPEEPFALDADRIIGTVKTA
jgi:uncharacterized protein